MQSRFEGKKVLVVGGSSGIGFATAQAFADEGAVVTIASRSRARLEEAAARISRPVAIAVLDTTVDAQVEAFFAAADGYDHVVVSAAQTAGGPVRKLPLADAYAAMNSKFWGSYRVARSARINEHGSLTLISGFLSVRPGSSVLQGAINAALESLGRGLALELAAQKIRVNTVSPGLIDTPLWGGMAQDARQGMFERAAASLPAGVVGQPEDIANAVLFLAATPFSTGSTVLVDGGGAIA